MLVLGLSGSLREDSHNRKLLRAAAKELPSGSRLAVWEGLAGLPAYDQDLDVAPAPPEVRQLRDALASADAILISTPEYNSSIPGALKNALDWASRPFPDNCLRDTPVAVVSGSPSPFGGVRAQEEVEKILGICGARVVEGGVALSRLPHRFGPDGSLDDEAAGEVRALLGRLARAAAPPMEVAA